MRNRVPAPSLQGPVRGQCGSVRLGIHLSGIYGLYARALVHSHRIRSKDENSESLLVSCTPSGRLKNKQKQTEKKNAKKLHAIIYVVGPFFIKC